MGGGDAWTPIGAGVGGGACVGPWLAAEGELNGCGGIGWAVGEVAGPAGAVAVSGRDSGLASVARVSVPQGVAGEPGSMGDGGGLHRSGQTG